MTRTCASSSSGTCSPDRVSQPSSTTCPNCAAPSVRIEIRDAFSLGELMQRFGYSMAPVKYALAELEGGPVCIDLEEYPIP